MNLPVAPPSPPPPVAEAFAVAMFVGTRQHCFSCSKFAMPSLNPEILEDIFIELASKYYNEDATKNVEKFMLSGKTCLEVALKLFSHAKYVNVNGSGIQVDFKNSRCHFSYKNLFIKRILTVLGSSVETLIIWDFPEDEFKFVLMDKLVREAKVLKKIEFFNHPDRYCIHLLKKVLSLDVQVVFNEEMALSDLTLIHLTPDYKLWTDFKDLCKKREENLSFPIVQKLEIQGYFGANQMNLFYIENFVYNVKNCFPNLTKLNVFFDYDECDWDFVLEFYQQLKRKHFEELPKILTGSIVFTGIECYYYIGEVEIVEQNDFTYDYEEGIIEKIFDIHEGLSFGAILRFKEQDGV